MRSAFFSLLCSLFICTAAHAQDRRLMTVRGTMPDHSYDGRTIVMEHHDPIYYDHTTVIDSINISNGSFSFSVFLPDSLRLRMGQLRLSTTISSDLPTTLEMPFILIEGVIEMTVDSLGITLKGELQNNQYSEMVLQAERQQRQQMFSINNYYNAIQSTRQLNSTESEEHRKLMDAVNHQFMTVYGDFIRHHLSYPYASELLFRYPLDRYNTEVAHLLRDSCDQNLLMRHFQRETAREERIRNFQRSVKETGIGHHFREISALDSDGNPVGLSSLVVPGHVTLLDIWASWCIPCRQEIPFLKEIYQKYHAQGFDIISISLDKSKEAWLNAVSKEAMPWPQISDLKAWDGPVAQDYGIQAIPFVLLLDQQGVITLRNLHGELLENAIRELLKKQ